MDAHFCDRDRNHCFYVIFNVTYYCYHSRTIKGFFNLEIIMSSIFQLKLNVREVEYYI